MTWLFVIFFFVPKMVNLSIGDETLHCFLSHTPKCLNIKLSVLFFDEQQFVLFQCILLIMAQLEEKKQLSYTSYKSRLAVITYLLQFWG